MDGLYGWVSNIVYYLIFVTMITNLLPAGKYEKYLRLFAGCILILLVIQPVTGGLRLDEKIAGLFKTLSFENEVGEMNIDLSDMENKRLEELVHQYEAAAAEDIGRMADLNGFEAPAVSVEIEERKDNPDFGKIKQITVLLRDENTQGQLEQAEQMEQAGQMEQAEQLEQAGQMAQAEQVEQIEQVKINITGMDTGEPPSSRVSALGKAEREEVKKLKLEIAEYYRVEEQYVEVKLENRLENE